MSALNTADGQARVAAMERAAPNDYQNPFSNTAQAMSQNYWGGGWAYYGNGYGGYGGRGGRPLNGWDHNSIYSSRDPAIIALFGLMIIGYVGALVLLILGGALLSIPLIIVGAVVLFVFVLCSIAIRYRRIYDNKLAAAQGYGAQPQAAATQQQAPQTMV